MHPIKKPILGISFATVVFYLIASGCAWVTLTAKDSLVDNTIIESGKLIQSVALEFAEPTGEYSEFFGDFKSQLRQRLEDEGFKLVSSRESPDLTLRINAHFYTKKDGVLYFFLGIIPLEDIYGEFSRRKGIMLRARYITDKDSWVKLYRAYNRQEADYWYGRLIPVIIYDLYHVKQ